MSANLYTSFHVEFGHPESRSTKKYPKHLNIKWIFGFFSDTSNKNSCGIYSLTCDSMKRNVMWSDFTFQLI